MIDSRNIKDLIPELQQKALDLIKIAKEKHGYDVRIVSTYRDNEMQDKLFSEGKTPARGGESWHNYRKAFDIAIFSNGKLDYESLSKYDDVGAIGEALGLTWGGRWIGKKKDRPHFQYGTIPAIKKKVV